MIDIIYGPKGSGKTKMIIDRANSGIDNQVGDIVFLTDTTRYIHDIKYQIRFTNSENLGIKSIDGLVGFIQGMVEANYDIRYMYIDGIARMVGKSLSEMEDFFQRLEAISQKSEVTFTLTISAAKEDIPEFIAKYIKD